MYSQNNKLIKVIRRLKAAVEIEILEVEAETKKAEV